MASHVLHFLQYRAPAKPIAELEGECIAPFLPSLTLAAADSPALIPHLLPSLYSHMQVPRALAYAGLDYVEIAQSVLEAEAATGGENPGSFPPEEEEEEEDDGSKKMVWKWDSNEGEGDDPDECHAFEVADEKERAKIAVLSVRQRAREFSTKGVSQLHEKDEESIWSNDAYLSELLCLLPIAVSRCPALLTPEQLVKGLLTASNGCALLVTTFANNPAEAERGALALANILTRHRDGNDTQPGSPHASESTSGAKAGGGPGVIPLSRQHSGALSQEHLQSLSSSYSRMVIRTLSSFCHVSPSFAGICRDALVKTCTLADMALQITMDIFQDELQFLSKLIFSKEKTSVWILSIFGSSQKHGESHHAPPPLYGKEKDTFSDHRSSSASQSSGKGVAQRVRDTLLADARLTWKKQGWSGRLHAHLRLYCVLIRVGDLQPGHEEVEFWLGVLGGSKEFPSENTVTNGDDDQTSKHKFVCERTLELGISFVCLIPGLSGPVTKTMLYKCVENLLRAALGNAPCSASTPEVELAVWVAVQLLQRRFIDVASFVREALGVQVTVHNAIMKDLADAAVAAGVVSDPFTAASAAAALRPKGPVPSPKRRTLYGLKCLEQLLHSTTFARCAVDISDTVMHYISIADEPIHPAFPSIIQGYTELSVSVPRARVGVHRFRMRPLSRASLIGALAPGLAILRDHKFSAKLSQSGKVFGKRSRENAHREGSMKFDGVGAGNSLATTALVTFYILCRESIARSMGIAGGSNYEGSSIEIEASEDGGWWLDLLHGLPLRELLMYMETNWPAYENLFPQWLGVASIVFPERFTAYTLLLDLEKTNTAFQTFTKDVPVTEDLQWVGPHETPSVTPEKSQRDVVGSGVESPGPMDIDCQRAEAVSSLPSLPAQSPVSCSGDGTVPVKTDRKGFSLEVVVATMKAAMHNPLPALRILRTFSLSAHPGAGGDSTEELEKFAGIGVEWPLEVAMMKELVPLLLDPTCPRCLQDQFGIWWRSLPSSALERLVPVLLDLLNVPTINSPVDHPKFTPGKQLSEKTKNKVMRLSTSGLAEEPLKLIACDIKVFRSPLLGTVLDLLQEILVANRRTCQMAASDGGRDGVKREEVAAALIAQDSAICQILLEACLPNPDLGDEERPGPLFEARCLILATICSLIHRSPLLLKLLHFQGYDQRLIPVMVEGVPAMVQCLEFIGELIQQSQQQRQVFAAVLTAHLTSLHPNLPQSLRAAQQVVAHVAQVRSKVAGCARFLQEVLSSVAQIAVTFPSLAPQVVLLLQSCAQAGGPLRRFGPPRDAGLHEAAVSAFKHLIQSRLLHGRPPPSENSIPSSST
ncbi:integrator complex subunit 2 [Marchantia polymorpha subsp. ruderalis]|uniref:Uncharacterized protein n=2 Tax=Marchantia polymorpha TaxID=3197 RepID=A0AAF6B7Y1_MARPO|nr:hypothetical protein MARPO_0112s0002 [Marchantia polymorpha]BBN08115.1 hypothetical protein Mp_4g09000 [Marchantia polymorpha subsp. ruderalis]|eukprot:PTQ31341.1 hypothetical protein MARPO_0112s0002 [Marchantia polymorpha]